MKDESGHGNHGTNYGAEQVDESMCISGKCLYFDNNNARVNCGQGESLNITGDEILIWDENDKLVQIESLKENSVKQSLLAKTLLINVANVNENKIKISVERIY